MAGRGRSWAGSTGPGTGAPRRMGSRPRASKGLSWQPTLFAIKYPRVHGQESPLKPRDKVSSPVNAVGCYNAPVPQGASRLARPSRLGKHCRDIAASKLPLRQLRTPPDVRNRVANSSHRRSPTCSGREYSYAHSKSVAHTLVLPQAREGAKHLPCSGDAARRSTKAS